MLHSDNAGGVSALRAYQPPRPRVYKFGEVLRSKLMGRGITKHVPDNSGLLEVGNRLDLRGVKSTTVIVFHVQHF